MGAGTCAFLSLFVADEAFPEVRAGELVPRRVDNVDVVESADWSRVLDVDCNILEEFWRDAADGEEEFVAGVFVSLEGVEDDGVDRVESREEGVSAKNEGFADEGVSLDRAGNVHAERDER